MLPPTDLISDAVNNPVATLPIEALPVNVATLPEILPVTDPINEE